RPGCEDVCGLETRGCRDCRAGQVQLRDLRLNPGLPLGGRSGQRIDRRDVDLRVTEGSFMSPQLPAKRPPDVIVEQPACLRLEDTIDGCRILWQPSYPACRTGPPVFVEQFVYQPRLQNVVLDFVSGPEQTPLSGISPPQKY